MDLSILDIDPDGRQAEAVLNNEKKVEETVYDELEYKPKLSYIQQRGWDYLCRKNKPTEMDRMQALEEEEKKKMEEENFVKKRIETQKELDEKTARKREKRQKRRKAIQKKAKK